MYVCLANFKLVFGDLLPLLAKSIINYLGAGTYGLKLIKNRNKY